MSLQDISTPGAPLADQIAITRTVRVAAGAFAPGHLGELTRLVPFEMVDEVLASTRRTQAPVRLLPARVVMYLLLAGCLFADLGYRQVWSKLTAGLHDLPVITPSGSALRQARQRLGLEPMRALFDLLEARPPRPPRRCGGEVCCWRYSTEHSWLSRTRPATPADTPSTAALTAAPAIRNYG